MGFWGPIRSWWLRLVDQTWNRVIGQSVSLLGLWSGGFSWSQPFVLFHAVCVVRSSDYEVIQGSFSRWNQRLGLQSLQLQYLSMSLLICVVHAVSLSPITKYILFWTNAHVGKSMRLFSVLFPQTRLQSECCRMLIYFAIFSRKLTLAVRHQVKIHLGDGN